MQLPFILRFSYWFDSTPVPFVPWVDRFLLILFSVLLLAGILTRFAALRHGWEKFVRRALVTAAWRAALLGLFGFLLYGLNYERIPVLSARVGYVLWIALAGWWIWKTIKTLRVDLPDIERQRAERLRAERWLPKTNA